MARPQLCPLTLECSSSSSSECPFFIFCEMKITRFPPRNLITWGVEIYHDSWAKEMVHWVKVLVVQAWRAKFELQHPC